MAGLPMQPSKARMAWLDIAKAVGIFLIVFGHLVTDDFVKRYLWTFHVPLFFFLSGYLWRPSDVRAFARRIVLRLVVPYVVAYVLLTLITLRTLDWHVLAPVLRGLFYGNQSYQGYIAAPLWFLPALVIVELLVFAMVQAGWLLYPAILGISLWLFHHGKINLLLSVDLALLGLNYFLFGMLARSSGLLQRLEAVPLAGGVAAGVGLALGIDLALAGAAWYGGPSYTRSLLAGVAGIAMLTACAQGLQRSPLLNNRAVRFLSDNTLFILCFHDYTNGHIWRWLVARGMEGKVVPSLIAAVVSIAMLVPFIFLFRRWAPWAIGVTRSRGIPASEPALASRVVN